MGSMMSKRILLTNRELVNLQGSELVTVELAEEFERMGYDVTVYAPRIGGGALDTSHLNTTTEVPDTKEFDILWIHHNQLIYSMGFRKAEGQIIIFNHMSSYATPEFPRIVSYEMNIADHILANSEETRAHLQSMGMSNITLFQNPAPRSFENCNVKSEYGLFVSNHRPAGLLAATQTIGIACKWIGHDDTAERITPEHLSRAAFVVCNGKTVQYALRARVPVFMFDHFGGNGWDFMDGERWNFSGRGVETVSLDRLMDWGHQLAGLCPERFRLELCLQELLG